MVYLSFLVFCTALFSHFLKCTHGLACPSKIRFAIGTFTESLASDTIAGEGVVFAKYKNGTVGVTSILSKTIVGGNPTYIARSTRGLYLCNSLSPDGEIKLIRKFYKGQFVKVISVTMPGQRPTHVSVVRRAVGELVVVANVNGGTVKTFKKYWTRLKETGSYTVSPSLASKLRNPFLSNRHRAPHPHMVLPYKDGVIVPDLGSDYVFYLSIDRLGALSEKQRIEFSPGDGPRHAIAHSSGVIFVVNELSSTMTLLKPDDRGILSNTSRVNLLNAGFVQDATAAAIRLSENEKFLYVSVRPDSRDVKRIGILVGFELDQDGNILRKLGEWSSLGVHPRDFYLVENMNVHSTCKSYIVVANRDSDMVVFIERNQQTGLLLHPDFTLTVKSPSSVLVY